MNNLFYLVESNRPRPQVAAQSIAKMVAIQECGLADIPAIRDYAKSAPVAQSAPVHRSRRDTHVGYRSELSYLRLRARKRGYSFNHKSGRVRVPLPPDVAYWEWKAAELRRKIERLRWTQQLAEEEILLRHAGF